MKVTLAVDTFENLVMATKVAEQWSSCGIEVTAHLGEKGSGLECVVSRDDNVRIAATGVSTDACTIVYNTSFGETAFAHEVGHALWLRDGDYGVMNRTLQPEPKRVGWYECLMIQQREPLYSVYRKRIVPWWVGFRVDRREKRSV